LWRGAIRGRSNLLAGALVAIIVILAFFNALNLASKLTQTSDSAQGFVVGHAIASGNVLLSGWHFPIDNFYFTDSIPYAAAEAVVGSRPGLMAVLPALVYACLVLLALLLCVRSGPSGVDWEPVAAVIVLLAVPVRVGSRNPMLMSDTHMATIVAALAALALLARMASAQPGDTIARFVAAPSFLLVALIVASDPFSLVFAFGPALAVLSIESAHRLRPPNVRIVLTLLAAAIVAGLLLPWMLALLGGLTTENDLTLGFAPPTRWWTNLVDVVSGILTLWGSNPLNVQSAYEGFVFAIRCAALAFVLFVLVHVARNLFRGGTLALLDRFLCAGAAVSLAACIPSAQFAKGVSPGNMWHGGPPMRFLVPAVLFFSIVVCGQFARSFDFWTNLRARTHFVIALRVLAGLVLLIGVLQFSPAGESHPSDRRPAIIAAHWIEQHHLSQGAGEYWSANLLTAMSGAAIGVRSMVPDHGRLVPYVWVEAQDFYASQPEFAVWQEPNQTGWTEAFVRATWHVCAIRTVAGYRIALLQASREFARCTRS